MNENMSRDETDGKHVTPFSYAEEFLTCQVRIH